MFSIIKTKGRVKVKETQERSGRNPFQASGSIEVVYFQREKIKDYLWTQLMTFLTWNLCWQPLPESTSYQTWAYSFYSVSLHLHLPHRNQTSSFQTRKVLQHSYLVHCYTVLLQLLQPSLLWWVEGGGFRAWERWSEKLRLFGEMCCNVKSHFKEFVGEKAAGQRY